MNIGTGIGTSIRELVETINSVTAFRGKIAWNADKPDGAMMKVLDVTRMKQALDGWSPPTALESGPGQDHRLVPGQQGPGGRQMVIEPTKVAGTLRCRPPGTRARLTTAAMHSALAGTPLASRAFLGGRLRATARRIAWRQARPRRAQAIAGRMSSATAPVERSARRILFINQYYWPDHASTAQHLTDLAEFLAAQGYECHVLASQGRYKPGEPRPPAFEIHEGVHIHRVPATSLGRRGTWARMTDYLSFYAGAVVKALLLPGSTWSSP